MKSPLRKIPREFREGQGPAFSWLVRSSLLLSFLVAVVHFVAIFPLVPQIPKWDQWSMIPVWSTYYAGGNVWPILLEPYNGHYNTLPRIVFFAVGLLSDWDVRLEVILSYVVASGTLVILAMMLRDTGRRLVLLSWLAALQVFSLVQFENYLSGYPFGQLLSQGAATYMVFVLTRATLSTRHVAMGAVAATIAAFSWGAGLVAWLVGLIALMIRRAHTASVVLWSLGTATVSTVAWLGASEAGLERSLTGSGLAPVSFAMVTIGKTVSFEAFPDVVDSAVLGTLVTGLFATTLLYAWQRQSRLNALRWSLFGFLGLGSCLLIGMGRIGAGIDQALASHYATAAYPVFLSTVVLTVTSASKRLQDRKSIGARLVAAGAGLIVLFGAIQPVAASMRTYKIISSWHGRSSVATERLLDGELTDDEIRRYFHPKPLLVKRGLSLMKKQKLSLYRSGQ